MLNHITIMGRLVADPELRYTPSNIPTASFRLAVDRDFKDRETGERKTDWIKGFSEIPEEDESDLPF